MKTLFAIICFFFSITAFAQNHSLTSLYTAHYQRPQAELKAANPQTILASDNFSFALTATKAQEVELMLLDGKQDIVWKKKVKLDKGENEIKCAVQNVPNGMYQLYIQAEKSYQQRSVYVKK
ncbi:MAG: hypothetical protein ACKVTZ_24235 [Bacteroidia bacterium]